MIIIGQKHAKPPLCFNFLIRHRELSEIMKNLLGTCGFALRCILEIIKHTHGQLSRACCAYIVPFVFPGGEVEADRTHTKWKENTTGRLLPLPRQIGVRFQGTFCRPPLNNQLPGYHITSAFICFTNPNQAVFLCSPVTVLQLVDTHHNVAFNLIGVFYFPNLKSTYHLTCDQLLCPCLKVSCFD